MPSMKRGKWGSLLAFFAVIVLAASTTHGEELMLSSLYNTVDKTTLNRVVETYEGASGSAELLTLKILGIAYHNLGQIEEKGSPAKAVEYLRQARQIAKKDMEVLAYLGSAQTMIARDSWNFLTKMSQVNKGVALIDKAVRKDPDNIVVRMVRAKNSLALPFFFKRGHYAKTDMLHVEKLLEQPQSLSDPDLKAEIMYRLGSIFQDDDQPESASAYFSKAIQSDPNSVWAKKAGKEVK